MMHPYRDLIMLLALTVTLSACGFQLRGASQIDPGLGPMSVSGIHAGSSLLPALRTALTDMGVEVARPGTRAVTSLYIVEEETGERVISVTPQGRPREAELFYRLTFELHDAAGEVMARRSLILTQEYAVDERDVLGRSHEAAVLRRALQRDIVNAVMRQLEPLESRHRP